MSQPAGSKRWCFTLNNFTNEEEAAVLRHGGPGVRYLIFAREHTSGGRDANLCPPGTPHLQGYIEFQDKRRLTQLKKLDGLGRAHWEVARGTAAQNIVYVSKEDPAPSIYGEPGLDSGSATRHIYSEAIELAKAGNLDDVDAGIRLRCYRTLQAIADEAEWKRAESGICPPNIVLRPWQSALESLIWQPAPDRTINCYVDCKGGAGKSTFSDWLHFHYGLGRTCGRPKLGSGPTPTVQVLHPSRGVDMAYLVRPATVFILDCPRQSSEYVPWATVEEIKNGFITSCKYQSTQKRFARPHVILFLNQPIQEGTFSEDRINVINLASL